MIHRELTRIHELKVNAANKNCDKSAPYKPLQYPRFEHARPLATTSSMACYKSFATSHPVASNIGRFLSNLRIMPSDQSLRGITWLELYILYRAGHNPKPIPDQTEAAKAKASAERQIQALKRITRGVVARILQDSPESMLFAPQKLQRTT